MEGASKIRGRFFYYRNAVRYFEDGRGAQELRCVRAAIYVASAASIAHGIREKVIRRTVAYT